MVGSFAVTHVGVARAHAVPRRGPADRRSATTIASCRRRSGLSRFKEIYFFKNFGSSVLFVLTCFVYPLAAASFVHVVPLGDDRRAGALLRPVRAHVRDPLRPARPRGRPRRGHPDLPGRARARSPRGGSSTRCCSLATRDPRRRVASRRIVGVRELLMVFAPVAQLAASTGRATGAGSRRATASCSRTSGRRSSCSSSWGRRSGSRAGLPANVFLRSAVQVERASPRGRGRRRSAAWAQSGASNGARWRRAARRRGPRRSSAGTASVERGSRTPRADARTHDGERERRQHDEADHRSRAPRSPRSVQPEEPPPRERGSSAWVASGPVTSARPGRLRESATSAPTAK